MMDETIRNFSKQFEYLPFVENIQSLDQANKYLVCAMGGSALSSHLLKMVYPKLDITVHSSYGLPAMDQEDLQSRLILFMSYSGNTEEVIDAYSKAKVLKLSMAVVTKGGRLLELAIADKIPYVKIPDTGIQPRNALGFSLRAQLKLMQENEIFEETSELYQNLRSENYEHAGRALAQRLKNKVPIIYSSVDNTVLARIWKIKFSETGKIPSYFESLPELNHNEMQGYYVQDKTQDLSKNFCFIFLRDRDDHVRIQKRMQITKELYVTHGLAVEEVEIEGESRWLRIFNSIYLVDWTAYYLATGYGFDPEKVEMVEMFKKKIA